MIIIRLSIHVAVEEHLVILCAEHDGFHDRILEHAFNPLPQLRSIGQTTETYRTLRFTRRKKYTRHIITFIRNLLVKTGFYIVCTKFTEAKYFSIQLELETLPLLI